MIQSKDLRLNNYVNYEPFNGAGFEIIQIAQLPLKKSCNIKPIELNEEILLKCGFEMNRLSFSIKFELNNFIIFKIDDYFYAKVIGMEIDLKSLHQLQNLYFCLCGNELNVNL